MPEQPIHRNLVIIVSIFWVLLHVVCLGIPFFGLEYEDSFIFSVSGRLLSIHPDLIFETPLTMSVEVGSVTSPELLSTYSGHYLGLSVLLAVFYAIFGYSTLTVALLNSAAAVGSGYVVFNLAQRLKGTGWQALMLFATAPAVIAFHGTGLSEPMSSLLVVGTVSSFLKPKPRLTAWLLLVFALGVKRENIVLLLLPIYSLVCNEDQRTPLRIALLALCTGLAVMLLDPIGTLQFEAADIRSDAFSMYYIPRLTPPLLECLLSPGWCGITFACAVAASLSRATRSPELLVVSAISILYLTMYVAHYRGPDFIMGAPVGPFAFLRYSVNVFPLLCVAGSPILCRIHETVGLFVLVLIALILSSCFTLFWRSNFSTEEAYLYANPVRQELQNTLPGGEIKTAIPVVYLFYGSSSTRVRYLPEN